MFKLKLLAFKYWQKLKIANYWLWAQAVFILLAFLRLLPAKAAIRFSAWVARKIGPLSSRHKVATRNLANAYPEKSPQEIEEIALEMWDSMARLLAEYVFLDAIFDFDPDAKEKGLIEVEGEEIFRRLLDEKKPHIFFTAHTGNFELLPICAATFGLNVTALFRPPNNPFIARKVLKARRTNMGHLVPSKAGAAWSLAAVLGQDDNVACWLTRNSPEACQAHSSISRLRPIRFWPNSPVNMIAMCIRPVVSACPAVAIVWSCRNAWNYHAMQAVRLILPPQLNCSMIQLRAGCANIRVNGCGSTNAGANLCCFNRRGFT
jgi:hypothetical protein